MARKPKAPPAEPYSNVSKERLFSLLNSIEHPIMGIDQAVDKTGVCALLPSKDGGKKFAQYLIERFSLTSVPVDSDWTELKKGRAHAGGILQLENMCCVIFFVAAKPSPNPEWELAEDLATELLNIFFEIEKLCGSRPRAVLESITLHGSKDSIAILPILGIYYATIFKSFLQLAGENSIGEISNGTWKKFISGDGRIPKKEVFKYWRSFSGISFSDDETDAFSLAVTAAAHYFDESAGKLVKHSRGRLRPPPKEEAPKEKED